MRRRSTGSGRTAKLAVLVLLVAASSAAQETGGDLGLELTSPVEQQLQDLQDAWQSWALAYSQEDEAASQGALEQLLSGARNLKLERLPNLSAAAATFAALSAQEGHPERTRWALEAARKLDPGRPEIHFAEAEVRRLDDDWQGAIASTLKGYGSLLRLAAERRIWLLNFGLWLLLALLTASSLFLALAMATKGGALINDLTRWLSPPMPAFAAGLLALALLLCPLALPAGLLFLVFFWSILIWSYCSASERTIFVTVWLILGAAPLLLSFQQRVVRTALSPEVRVLENLATERLHGALFTDLGALRALVSESSATRELVADLHRRFGQWEYARSTYNQLVNSGALGSRTAPAYINLGIYHHRKKDYATAVNFFRTAAQADPGSAEACFNLAKAYGQLFNFSESNQAMECANNIDRERVAAWEGADVPPDEIAVGVDGGLQRSDEIRAEIAVSRHPDPSAAGAEPYVSFAAAAAYLLLALVFHGVRSRWGHHLSPNAQGELLPPAIDRWARALIPGLASARNGRGTRTFLALLLPAGFLALLALPGLSYRPPVAFGPETLLSTSVGLGGLLLLFLVRLGKELRA